MKLQLPCEGKDGATQLHGIMPKHIQHPLVLTGSLSTIALLRKSAHAENPSNQQLLTLLEKEPFV